MPNAIIFPPAELPVGSRGLMKVFVEILSKVFIPISIESNDLPK